MHKFIFLLANIENPEFMSSLSDCEKDNVEQFLYEMELGPGDGEMAIEWQSECKGYYAHLKFLHLPLQNDNDRTYKILLEDDIEKWKARSPGNFMVEEVENILESYRD
jgi:hypothetical protein